MTENLRLVPPDEAMVRNEAGVFTASSLRTFYLSISELIVRLGLVENLVSAVGPGLVGPIGSGMLWSGDVDPVQGAPTDPVWLITDGRAIDRVIYQEYFLLVGERYGPGDGVTTFNIPDNRNRGIAMPGLNAGALGAQGGAWEHVHTYTEVPLHNHIVVDPGHVHTATSPVHSHGPGTLDASLHTHPAGTLVGADHLHAAGTLVVANHTHPAGTLVGSVHTHPYSLLQHSHDSSLGIVDPGHGHGINDPQHNHGARSNGGNLEFAAHNHGSGTLVAKVPSNNVSLQTSGTQFRVLEGGVSIDAPVQGNTGERGGNVNGSTGTQATGITINNSPTGISLSGSVGNVSGSLPGGTTGDGGGGTVTGSTGDGGAQSVTGNTAGSGATAITGSTGEGGGGVISGSTEEVAVTITVDSAVTGVTTADAGVEGGATTETNSEPFPYLAWNIICRVL